MNAAAAFIKDVNGPRSVQQTFGFGIAELASEGWKPFSAAELLLLNARIAKSICSDCRTECCGDSFCGSCFDYHLTHFKTSKIRVQSRSHRNAA
jgi:hypothetical protein